MLRETTTANHAASSRVRRPWDDFDGLGYYYQYRPEYPSAVAEQLWVMLENSTGGTVIEVGAGTGLFTRSIATALGPAYRIVAIEPNKDMRRHAASQTPAGMPVTYMDGIAEHLAVAGHSVQLLTAANAVHRFNRSVFYQEAERVLIPGGLLALVQYKPFHRGSAFADDFLSAIEGALPTYRRHRHSTPGGGFSEIDLTGELKGLSAFQNVKREAFVYHEQIDLETFMHRALSYTIVQKAMFTTGCSHVMAHLFEIFDKHADQTRLAAMPYEAEMITARRVDLGLKS
ncbi:class I SAM-dependent methyltransferase [Rhizobium mongolense]|uniref:Ubiquinone/menaquinone biosynthesis C-methylase UbiE n=2 Tax=Rhizobium mongolense TaxID=57676 RepID=A0ABR6IY52_9HYPH|nr:class I SAM-dependent methyltransferase [Rhizobium mongolense]MBB4232854.1 ubiquinone/menaquinone biosynthesis C-methylase UbiE [Rhizobium mongolense]TVZ75125.1 methyltransferase family protein [Rhizobium mongolense USDA 1844]